MLKIYLCLSHIGTDAVSLVAEPYFTIVARRKQYCIDALIHVTDSVFLLLYACKTRKQFKDF